MLRLIFTSYFGAVGIMSFFIIKSPLIGISLCMLCLFAIYAINYKQ